MQKHMQKLFKLLDPFNKYLICALLVIIPLYPKFPFITIPGIYVAIRLEDFLVAIIALATFIKLFPRIKDLFKDEITRAIFVFLVVGIVSLISGVYLTKTIQLSLGFLHFFRRIEYFVPLFAVFAFFSFEKGKNLEFYLKVLMIVVFVAFLYGIGEKFFHFPVIITQNDEYSKGIALLWTPGTQLNSTFAGHYDLATFLVFLLPIFISLFFIYKKISAKVLLGAVIFSGLWLLSETASRTSIAAYLATSSFSLFIIKKYKAIPLILIASLIFFGASSDVLARYTQIIEVTYKKVMNVKLINYVPHFTVLAQDGSAVLPQRRTDATPTPVPVPVFEDRSTSIRLNVEWPRAIRALEKNPLLGTGYSSIGLATDNDYLRLLGEIGILGFASFILIFVRIGLTFMKAFPLIKNFEGTELGFIAGVIGGTIGVLINAVFIDVFEASKIAIIFWLILAIAIYTVKYKLNAEKN